MTCFESNATHIDTFSNSEVCRLNIGTRMTCPFDMGKVFINKNLSEYVFRIKITNSDSIKKYQIQLDDSTVASFFKVHLIKRNLVPGITQNLTIKFAYSDDKTFISKLEQHIAINNKSISNSSQKNLFDSNENCFHIQTELSLTVQEIQRPTVVKQRRVKINS